MVLTTGSTIVLAYIQNIIENFFGSILIMSLLLDWNTLQTEFANRTIKLSKSNTQLAMDSASNNYDIFLSHRFKDKHQVDIIKYKFESYGYSVFVDWEQDTLKDRSKVTKDTATLILEYMKKCKVLVFVITDNFKDSLWMAWELGNFHSLELGGIEKIALMPIATNHDGKYNDHEFLQLYSYIDECEIKGEQKKQLWVNDPKKFPSNYTKYVSFKNWLTKGTQPFKRET